MTNLPWEPHPDAWLLVGTLAALYTVAAFRIAPRVSRASGVVLTRAQIASFALGLFALWLVTAWPVDDVADQRMFSVHMVQHLVLVLVVAPLIIAGTPAWLARWLLRPGTRPFTMMAWCYRFVPAVLLFNFVFVAAHLPLVIDATVRHPLIDLVDHTVLVLMSFLVWLPVLSPLPELPRLRPVVRCLYLFTWSILPTLPASFLTFGSAPLYSAYRHTPKLWGLTTLQDQQMGGLIMKLGMGALLWGVITVIFFRWSTAEERQDLARRRLASRAW